ncbi:UNVERIFIED_ORG: hypothetical protein E4P37_16365 [Bacillus sp. AZ43]
MPCPTCGATDARTQILPGYWRCDAAARAGQLVGGPAPANAPTGAAQPSRCGTIYLQTRLEEGAACRCGDPAIGECTECTRAVCGDHSTLWQGWRVCDRDLANARVRSRAAAVAEERRREAEAAAAEAERHRQRTTLLQLGEEDAVWILYADDAPRTEQEIRSAVHVLRGLTAEEFTDACLYLLRQARRPETRRTGLTRLTGWAFEGPDYHGRSWFLTRKGAWHRSGAYGTTASEQGRWRKIRFDDVEKRAVIDEMSWQQSVDSGLL